MSITIEAEYIAEDQVLKLAAPLTGVGNHEKVRLTIDESRAPERGDWPALGDEAGRELARALRDAFGRDGIAL